MELVIKLGTRGSKLALLQSIWVKEKIEERWKHVKVELVKIKTKGDRILDAPLSKIGGKGVFVKDIEVALLKGSIDFAVHSMKDVPAEIEKNLDLPVIPEREDPRDVFVSRTKVSSIMDIPEGARIGTSSLRRTAQIRALRPDLEVVPIRGNLDTRIKKIEVENLFGIIVAAAGINRMGLQNLVSFYFEPDEMIPAVGQGALALETRKDDKEIIKYLEFLDDENTRVTVLEERDFLYTMGGGCQVPMGGFCTMDNGRLKFFGFVGDMDGRIIKEVRLGSRGLGKGVAEDLLRRGGREIMEEILG